MARVYTSEPVLQTLRLSFLSRQHLPHCRLRFSRLEPRYTCPQGVIRRGYAAPYPRACARLAAVCASAEASKTPLKTT